MITNAAAGNANVKELVYIDAFVPDVGESVLDLAAKNPGSGLPVAITEVPYQQGAQGSGVDVYIRSADFRSVFAADVPAGQAAIMAATQRPVTLAALSEKSLAEAWKTIPSWYLIGRQDDAIPLVTEQFMAHRAQSHTVTINSSHASLVSHPAAVTKLVLAAAHAAGRVRRGTARHGTARSRTQSDMAGFGSPCRMCDLDAHDYPCRSRTNPDERAIAEAPVCGEIAPPCQGRTETLLCDRLRHCRSDGHRTAAAALLAIAIGAFVTPSTTLLQQIGVATETGAMIDAFVVRVSRSSGRPA